jgi:hypothetical protein
MIESKTFESKVLNKSEAAARANESESKSPPEKAKIIQFQPQIAAWRFSTKGVAVRLFLTCWLVFALHFATNTVREIYPALSLGDRLSFDVSEYAGLHPDIFAIEGRGAFINNNPGASILGAIPYAIFRPVTDRIIEKVRQNRAANPQIETANYDSIYPLAREFYKNARERGFDVKFGLAAAQMQAFIMAPLSALAAVVMFFIFLHLTKNAKTAALLALLFAFATPVFYRTAQLNQNLLVAHFALFSFALLWRFWQPQRKPFYFLSGLCAGWTVVLDYSGLVAVAALSGYALARWRGFSNAERNWQDLANFTAGISACAAVLMIYQWLCFGNPIFPAQSYMPPANFTDQGYRGFSFPQIDLFFETAFSMRYGLFTSAPILLLAFFAPVWLSRKNRLLENRELIFVVAFTILFFAFCAANQYGRMQFNTGVRHIVPVVPFAFLLAANVLLKLPRLIAVLIGIFATYWSWCLAQYRDVEQGFGVFEAIKNVTLEGFRLPWLETLERMGFVQNASPIPLFLVSAILIWALWSIGARMPKTTVQ